MIFATASVQEFAHSLADKLDCYVDELWDQPGVGFQFDDDDNVVQLFYREPLDTDSF